MKSYAGHHNRLLHYTIICFLIQYDPTNILPVFVGCQQKTTSMQVGCSLYQSPPYDKKNPENIAFPGFLIFPKEKLSLGELRSATSGLETVLLSLLHTRITCKESCLLK